MVDFAPENSEAMSIHPAYKKKKNPIKHAPRNYIVEIHEQQNKIAFPSKNKQTNKIAHPYLSLCETLWLK